MSTWYIDPVNGSDSNAGTSWGTAFKTIDGATAAKGVAAGDTVKIAKSPDPTSLGQTALFTNLSRDVVLQTGAVTAEIDNCETTSANWTAFANITLTNDTSQYKLGANSLKLAVAAAFTTGKAAYRDFGAGNEKNLSGYQQISFWLRNSAAIAAAGYIKVKLCSDASGDTPVDTFSVPAIPSTNQWVPITIDKGSALGSSIRSIAVYVDTDFGAVDLYFDNIIACKAASAADSLTLQSLISKNSAAQGGTEHWYGIQSINGATIKIDNHTNQLGNGGRGYTGTTETVTIYKRETIKTSMAAVYNTQVQTVQVAGSYGNLIEFQGGYDTSTGLQDGETIFSGSNGHGWGINTSGKSYVWLNFLGCCHYNTGLNSPSWTKMGAKDTNLRFISCTSSGYVLSEYRQVNQVLGNLWVTNCGGVGVVLGSPGAKSDSGTSISSYGNSNYGVSLGQSPMNFATFNSKNNTLGIAVNYGNISISALNSANNDNGAILLYGSIESFIKECNYSGENLLYAADPSTSPVYIRLGNINSGPGGLVGRRGTILQENSVRHTASGYSWKLSPTDSALNSDYPLFVKVAEAACNANKQVTVKAWLRRSNTGLTMSLVCRGGQIAGVASDVISSTTAAADTWEEVTITFTPTEAGVVEIEVWAYGGTTYSGYVDDMTLDQAA